MRSLNKQDKEIFTTQIARFSEAQAEHEKLVADAKKVLESAIEVFLRENQSRIKSLEEAVKSSATELLKLSQDNSEKMESYILDRSDAWHETDSAHHYSDWSEDWSTFSQELNEIDCFCFQIDLSIDSEALCIEIPALQPKAAK